MAFGNYGHIRMTVSSTDYDFLTDLSTYQEVDITDFAPRAISGSPALSEMGLYTDASQQGFSHGFGQHTFSEPLSYAYAGSGVDTRHKYIGLFSEAALVNSGGTPNWTVNKILTHDSQVVLATSSGTQIVRGGGTSVVSAAVAMPTGTACRDIVDMGEHLLFAQANQTQVGDVFQATSGGATTITDSNANWTVDVFNGGTATIVDGTGIGQTKAVSDTTATALTTAAFSPVPDSTSVVIVIADTAIASADNFGGFGIFGGFVWAWEDGTNFLHYASENDGSDLEGGGTADTGVIQVGVVGTKITNLRAFNNQLWAFKEDGAWTISEDNLAYHTLNHRDEVSSDNFKTCIVWNGFLTFPIRNTLYKYRSGLQDITPPNWDDYPPEKRYGNFSGLLARGPWLYVLGVANAVGVSEGAPETSTGHAGLLATSGVGWHKLWTFPQTTPTNLGMWLDNLNDALYIFGTSTNGYLYKIPLQALSDLPYVDFETGVYHNFYSSYYDMGLQRIPKSFASVTLSGDFPTNANVRVQYRVDDDTAFTTLGTADEDLEELSFTNITGKRIQLRLQLYTTLNTVTPHIRAIILKTMLRPDVLYGVTCDILLADKLSDQNRLINGMTTQEIRTALKAARASVSPISFTGIGEETGADAYVASVRFTVIGYEDSDDVELMARCTIVYV